MRTLLNYDVVYRGGYEYVVDEATKAELIAGGVGIVEGNFTALWNIGSIILNQ